MDATYRDSQQNYWFRSLSLDNYDHADCHQRVSDCQANVVIDFCVVELLEVAPQTMRCAWSSMTLA